MSERETYIMVGDKKDKWRKLNQKKKQTNKSI